MNLKKFDDLENSGEFNIPYRHTHETCLNNGWDVFYGTGKRTNLHSWNTCYINNCGYLQGGIEYLKQRPFTIAENKYTWDKNTCIRTGLAPYYPLVIDSDSRNENHAKQIYRKIIDEHPKLYHNPLRIGNYPKFALFTRLENGDFSGFSHSYQDLDINFGNQIIGYGIHPDTEKPYYYITDSHPLNTPIWNIPSINRDELENIINIHQTITGADRNRKIIVKNNFKHKTSSNQTAWLSQIDSIETNGESTYDLIVKNARSLIPNLDDIMNMPLGSNEKYKWFVADYLKKMGQHPIEYLDDYEVYMSIIFASSHINCSDTMKNLCKAVCMASDKFDVGESFEYKWYHTLRHESSNPITMAQICRYLNRFVTPSEYAHVRYESFDAFSQFVSFDDSDSVCAVPELYQKYAEYCKQNGFDAISSRSFGIQLKRLNGNQSIKKVKRRINGKVVWHYSGVCIQMNFRNNTTSNPIQLVPCSNIASPQEEMKTMLNPDMELYLEVARQREQKDKERRIKWENAKYWRNYWNDRKKKRKSVSIETRDDPRVSEMIERMTGQYEKNERIRQKFKRLFDIDDPPDICI